MTPLFPSAIPLAGGRGITCARFWKLRNRLGGFFPAFCKRQEGVEVNQTSFVATTFFVGGGEYFAVRFGKNIPNAQGHGRGFGGYQFSFPFAYSAQRRLWLRGILGIRGGVWL